MILVRSRILWIVGIGIGLLLVWLLLSSGWCVLLVFLVMVICLVWWIVCLCFRFIMFSVLNVCWRCF